jgi:hypothetical protein
MPVTVDLPIAKRGVGPFIEWFDRRFRRANGEPYSARSRRRFVRQLHLPVIKIGEAEMLDYEAGDEVLRQHARYRDGPRRGRPPILPRA